MVWVKNCLQRSDATPWCSGVFLSLLGGLRLYVLLLWVRQGIKLLEMPTAEQFPLQLSCCFGWQ